MRQRLERHPRAFQLAHGSLTIGRQVVGRARRFTDIRAWAASDEPKLQLGAGAHVLGGWLNTDFAPKSTRHVQLDVTKPFPVPDGVVAVVFSEHQIEHLTWAEGQFMLGECFRVMRPGGRLRIVTPDARVVARVAVGLATPEELKVVSDWVARFYPAVPAEFATAFALNVYAHEWGHKFLYDPDVLGLALTTQGFTEPEVFGLGESVHPALVGVDRRETPEDTFAMEATRP